MAITAKQARNNVKVKIPQTKSIHAPHGSFINEIAPYDLDYLIINSPPEGAHGSVGLAIPNGKKLNFDTFSLGDLDLYEEPTAEPDFTVANQPFTLIGAAYELRRFRDEWINLGYCSHRDKIEEGMGLLVNFEPDYPPYMRIHLDMFGSQEGYELNRVREKLLEWAAVHAAKATKPPLRKSPAPSAVPEEYYNGKEVFNQMLALYGKDQVAAFCRLNAFKYRMRAGKKDSNSAEQDIKKALWYEAELAELTK